MGMGYMDGRGPRIEVIPCSGEEVSKIEMEVAATEAATGGGSLEQELRDCMQTVGITFDENRTRPDGAGRRRLKRLTAILLQHPDASFRIVGYAEPKASAELALRRNSVVRKILVDAGCTRNLLVDSATVELPTGNGGARCEVEVTTEATHIPLDSLLGGAFRRNPLEVVFESPAGLRHIAFNRRPLGLSYHNVVPLVVSKVHPQGQAEQLGVQVGWEFRMVCSRHVSGLDFSEIQEILLPAVAQLPVALS